jgi:hypothetical protein
VAGDNGLVHWNGLEWLKMSVPTYEPLTAVWADAHDVWVVGASGAILHAKLP